MKTRVSPVAFAMFVSSASLVQAQDLTIPKAMCDAGVFVAGGTYSSFEDIIVESTGATDLNDKGPVFAYGYLADVEFGNELNDRVNTTISTVDTCYANMGVVQIDTNLRVDVVLTRDDFDEAAWKSVRRTLLKVRGDIINAKALVRLTGQFGIYSNTNGLYFRAKDVTVLATFP